MDCSSITDFQQSTAICIAKKFRNLHIGFWLNFFCRSPVKNRSLEHNLGEKQIVHGRPKFPDFTGFHG